MRGIILWILTFIILVLLHEFGHFIAAKKSGVQVKEFWLGMPPRLMTLRSDKSGTKYTLNCIPLWGFVSLKGEDGADGKENKDPDSFVKAKLRKKLIIVMAGVAMNFLIAWIVFSILFFIGTKPMTVIPDDAQGMYSESYLMPSMSFIKNEGFLSGELQDGIVTIEHLVEWGLAEEMGLQTGATLLRLNGQEISSLTLSKQLSKLANTKNNTLEYTPHDAESWVKTLTFDCPTDCKLGIIYAQSGDLELLPVKFGLGRAMLAWLKEIKAEWNLTMSALGTIGKKLFSFEAGQTKDALKQLTWPVGAVKFGEKLLEEFWFLIFLGFGGMLSIALAIFNVLPIPALDGGRFRALILQKLFRLKDEKFAIVEGWVNTVFFWVLMLLGIIIILKDLVVWRGIKLPFIA